MSFQPITLTDIAQETRAMKTNQVNGNIVKQWAEERRQAQSQNAYLQAEELARQIMSLDPIFTNVPVSQVEDAYERVRDTIYSKLLESID